MRRPLNSRAGLREVCVHSDNQSSHTSRVCMGSYRSSGWHIKPQKNLISARSLSPLGHDIQSEQCHPVTQVSIRGQHSHILPLGTGPSWTKWGGYFLPRQLRQQMAEGYCYEDTEKGGTCLGHAGVTGQLDRFPLETWFSLTTGSFIWHSPRNPGDHKHFCLRSLCTVKGQKPKNGHL